MGVLVQQVRMRNVTYLCGRPGTGNGAYPCDGRWEGVVENEFTSVGV